MMYNAITNKRIYQEEQNELLYNLLQKRFFQFWEKPELFQDNTSLSNNSNIELFITPYCNQSCSYCYLVKYPELYPKEISYTEMFQSNPEIKDFFYKILKTPQNVQRFFKESFNNKFIGVPFVSTKNDSDIIYIDPRISALIWTSILFRSFFIDFSLILCYNYYRK